MITCTAIVFIVLWYKAKTKRDQYAEENSRLKMEIKRLNGLLNTDK